MWSTVGAARTPQCELLDSCMSNNRGPNPKEDVFLLLPLCGVTPVPSIDEARILPAGEAGFLHDPVPVSQSMAKKSRFGAERQ